MDGLLHEHHRFADSMALFQVAIALGAVAVLTRMRLVWFGSLLVRLIGAGLFRHHALTRATILG